MRGYHAILNRRHLSKLPLLDSRAVQVEVLVEKYKTYQCVRSLPDFCSQSSAALGSGVPPRSGGNNNSVLVTFQQERSVDT